MPTFTNGWALPATVGQFAAGPLGGKTGGTEGGETGGAAGGGEGTNEPSPGEATPSEPAPQAARPVTASAPNRAARTALLEVILVSLDAIKAEGDVPIFV
jgi:hypothetical protein